MSEQLALLPAYLTGHLQLTLAALLIAIATSLPLGILAVRTPRLEQPLLAIAAVIQTIPSLALLAVTVPLLAALQLRSIGFLPALIGLTLYGLLPILRNTVTGIAGVDPALKEAARGVGMTAGQQLRRVELPLAMPVIVAGIRTATVWTVGTATLSTPVGAPSLGNFIGCRRAISPRCWSARAPQRRSRCCSTGSCTRSRSASRAGGRVWSSRASAHSVRSPCTRSRRSPPPRCTRAHGR
jgi:ABC-type proline/glycine betaine transport system permease subunit